MPFTPPSVWLHLRAGILAKIWPSLVKLGQSRYTCRQGGAARQNAFLA
jgi:hypothetical protein